MTPATNPIANPLIVLVGTPVGYLLVGTPVGYLLATAAAAGASR